MKYQVKWVGWLGIKRRKRFRTRTSAELFFQRKRAKNISAKLTKIYPTITTRSRNV